MRSDFISYSGDSLNIVFVLKNLQGQYITNFEADRIDMWLKKDKYSKEALKLSSDDEVTINIDKISVQISSDQSKNLSGQYLYDLQATYSSGQIQTLHQGYILFQQDVTRP